MASSNHNKKPKPIFKTIELKQYTLAATMKRKQPSSESLVGNADRKSRILVKLNDNSRSDSSNLTTLRVYDIAKLSTAIIIHLC